MAQKQRFLDVWIVESDTVYKEVPYTVVVDWVQQGRLLESDKLRWSGKADWVSLGSVPSFAAYLPRADAFQANDQAEALEPVHVDFSWKPRHDEEEGDVDMIPLIDVSLVLLIFFMMTASAAASGLFPVSLAPAQNGSVVSNTELVWIALQFKTGEDGKVDRSRLVYTLGQGQGGDHQKWDAQATKEQDPSQTQVLEQIAKELQKKEGLLEVSINADKDVPEGPVRDLTSTLEGLRAKVTRKYIGVSEKETR